VKKAARDAKRDERWDRETTVRELRWSAESLTLNLVELAAHQELNLTLQKIARGIIARRAEADELERQR